MTGRWARRAAACRSPRAGTRTSLSCRWSHRTAGVTLVSWRTGPVAPGPTSPWSWSSGLRSWYWAQIGTLCPGSSSALYWSCPFASYFCAGWPSGPKAARPVPAASRFPVRSTPPSPTSMPIRSNGTRRSKWTGTTTTSRCSTVCTNFRLRLPT